MAFQIKGYWIVEGDLSIIEHGLPCYDTIGDPAFDMDRDGYLEMRSAFELVREELSETQAAELDKIDAYWRANPTAFNFAFSTMHHQNNRRTVLAGFAQDEKQQVPAVPRSHWWWHPIEGGE